MCICFSASSQTGSILTSQLKSTNGLVSGAGLELATPAGISAAQLSTAQDIGLFINQHVGYAQPITTTGQNLQIVKREPEDLSHHRRIDTNSPDLESGGIIIEARQRPKVNHQTIHSFLHFHQILSQCPVYLNMFTLNRNDLLTMAVFGSSYQCLFYSDHCTTAPSDIFAAPNNQNNTILATNKFNQNLIINFLNGLLWLFWFVGKFHVSLVQSVHCFSVISALKMCVSVV